MTTVQLIPEKLFLAFRGNWYGESYYATSGLFEERVLVQPVKFDGRMFSFGVHKTREITEFIFFNTTEPFSEHKLKKNTIVLRLAGGEVLVTIGTGKSKYYNRLIEPASAAKVLFKTGSFHVLGTVFNALDLLVRKYHVEKMPKYIETLNEGSLGIVKIIPFDPNIKNPYSEYED